MKNWQSFLTILLFLFVLNGSAYAQPTGFIDQQYVGSFDQAVGLTFDDNGRMYVYEKGGKVWIVDNGQLLPNPLLDISDEVGNWRDFGMLGFVLDPNFLSNGYIYCLYIVDRHHLLYYGTNDYNPNADEYFNATIGRITRFQADASTGFTTLVPNSRNVLLGETISNDGFANLHQSHGTGSLVFGTDGTLLASFGDGSSYSSDDVGSASETYWSQALSDGIISSSQNVGAFRVQLLDNLAGKLIRIDPATGEGIPSNPYYESGDPGSASSKIWALGLRNPCRMTLKPETGSHDPADGDPGVVFIGDVGWGVREELNVVDAPGLNFGWPRYEGMTHTPNGYNDPDYYPEVHTLAKVDWRTGSARGYVNGNIVNVGSGQLPGPSFTGNCSIGGVWYGGSDFPAEWNNTYFHADYGGDWIKNFTFDENNNPIEVKDFKSGANGIVFIGTNPLDGGLYYIAGGSGNSNPVNNYVRKISFTGGNLPPFALASANVIYGTSPLTVNFKGDLSYDPNGDAISYDWDFGDGSSSTEANPTHTFTNGSGQPTAFTVTLTISDGSLSEQQSLIVSLNNTPPQILSTSIDNINSFSHTNATSLNLNATVTDAEHNISQLTFEWFTELHHNNHFHSEAADNSPSTSTELSPVGCDGATYFYRIKLVVTDPAGLTGTYSKDIYPDCGGSDQTISFNPLEDKLNIDPPFQLSASASSGLPVIFHIISGPASISGNTLTLDGTPGIVTVRAIQSGDNSYAPAIPVEHTFTVNPSGGTGLNGTYYNNMDLTNEVFTRVDPTIDFQWGSGSPDPSIGANTFSVRWEGLILPLFDEQYTFTTTTDDGVRLWIDGQLIIDQWVDQSPTSHSNTISLTGGEQVPIVMEYFENGGGAVAELRWSSNSQANQIVPQFLLFPDNSPPDTDPPGVTLSTGSNNVSGSFIVNVSFDEIVTGLSENDFNITNGSASGLSGSGQSYSLTVSPGVDGQVTIQLPADQAQDNAGNGNTISNQLSITYTEPVGDVTPPSVTLTTSSNDVSGPFEVIITIDETVAGLTEDDFNITNGTAQNDLSNVGLNYYFTINPINDGTVSITLPANTIQDLAGNNNGVSNLLSVTYTAPGGGDCNNPTNIALNKPAALSSPHSSNAAGPELAVDGNTSGNWFLDYSVSSTSWESEPWWQVDLESISEIQTINIWNRTDCCQDFLSDYYILISDDPFISDDLNTVLNQPGVSNYYQATTAGAPSSIAINSSGRYVRIQNSSSGFIALAEVEIFGCESGNTGGTDITSPDVSLSTSSNTVSGPFNLNIDFNETVTGLTDSDFTLTNGTASNLTGSGNSYTITITPLADGNVSIQLPEGSASDAAGNTNNPSNTLNVTYTEPVAGDCNNPGNVALNKPTSQSSAYGGVGAGSELAVDGNTSGVWFGDYSVSSTSWGNQPWWEVDLETLHTIDNINIWNRTDCCSDFLSDYYVFVSDVPFVSDDLEDVLNQPGVTAYHQTTTAGTPSALSIGRTGRFIRIQNSGPGFIALAEVEVIGCINNGGGDTTPPSVTLTSNTQNTSGNFSVTLNFDEDVIGLSNTDLNIINGSASGLNGNGQNYAVTIIPDQAGQVTVNLPAGVVTDLSGNSNLVSNTINVTYTPPPIPTVQIISPSEGSIIAGTEVTVSFQVSGDLAGYGAEHLLLTLGSDAIDIHDLGTGGTHTFTDVPFGAQILSAQLTDNFHVPISFPEAYDEITFTTIQSGGGSCDILENLALTGTASQSSDHSGGSAGAELAIDGNTSGVWYGDYSVSSTSWETNPWWEIDLGALYNIEDINIWNRTDCCSDFLSDYYVLISDVPFVSGDLSEVLNQSGVLSFHQTTTAATPTTVTLTGSGRYVRIQNNNTGFVALAEVEIMGCLASGNSGFENQSDGNNNIEANLYPNPANDYVVVKYTVNKAGNLRYIIANSQGVIYKEEEFHTEQGDGTISTFVKQWPAGTYIFYLQMEGYKYKQIPFIRIRD